MYHVVLTFIALKIFLENTLIDYKDDKVYNYTHYRWQNVTQGQFLSGVITDFQFSVFLFPDWLSNQN